jgi:hypothetical protein
LDAGSEFVVNPFSIDHAWCGLATDNCVANIGVHGRGVIAPNSKLVDVGNF